MSEDFYDFQVLEEGTKEMISTIKQLYPDQDRLVSPPVKPGFLRHTLPGCPPEQGMPILDVIRETKQKVYPGIMLWGSPRFFGYFPSTVSATNIIAEMFVNTFHSPGFTYTLSPSHTEMENIVVDWACKALGLPEKFLLCNEGGGVIYASMTESVFVSVHAAKVRKMEQINVNETPEKIVKLVGYYSQFGFMGNERAMRLKQIFHIKCIPVRFCDSIQNFVLDTKKFEEIVEEDVKNGLFPFWFGMTYGTTFTGANDVNEEVVRICRKHGIWMNVDAAYLGVTWICPEFRPNMKLIEHVDSFATNFSKSMFMGSGGNLFFVADKKQLTKAFAKNVEYSFLDNQFSKKQDIVDYKDWSFGLMRKNNSLKLFYLFRFYGLERLRAYIRDITTRAQHLEMLITKSGIFKLYTRPTFGLVCFRLCDKTGKQSNELTKAVIEKVSNIPEGFMSAGTFGEDSYLRIVIGNNSSTIEVVEKYFNKILQIGRQSLQAIKIQ